MSSPEPTDPGVVIVGAGLAGGRTCVELRAHGYAGKVTLLGAEAAPPYERPPLSKGHVAPTTGDLRLDFDHLEVDFRPAATAIGLAGASRAADAALRVQVAGADDLPADAVVVASGATPIVPAGWSTGPSVRVLRTRADALAWGGLIEALGPLARIAVLGGSWIGLEFASRLSASGLAAVVIEKASWLLPNLPPEVGRQVRRWCVQAGIDVQLGLPVEAVTAADAGEGLEGVTVVTAGGQAMHADAALVALGVAPATGWLAETGLGRSVHSGALRVDQHLRSSDPRVVGVGDAVERWSPRYRGWLPGGHWQDAMDAPAVAAQSVIAALAGAGPPTVDYDAVPYFWSEMFGHTLQWTGFLPDHRSARMVVRGDLDAQAWSICWLDEDARLRALLSCDRPRDAVAARKAQAADPVGAPEVDVDALADPDRPLRDCFTARRGG